MKIKELYIRSFGKLKDYRLSLNDGMNVVFGNNEAGKTTLFSFILAMLYGFSNTRGKGAEESARKKYMTWGENSVGGTMTVEHNGITYVVERSFGRTKAGDNLTFTNLALGEKVALPSGKEVGEYLLDLDERAFKGTCFIGQLNKGDVCGNDSVKTKLSNLSSTGDVDYSFDVVFKRLKNISAEITRKTSTGRIYPLELERQALVSESREIVAELSVINDIAGQNDILESERKAFEKELEQLQLKIKNAKGAESTRKYRDALQRNRSIEKNLEDVQEKRRAITNKGFVADREYIETLRALRSDCELLEKECAYAAESADKLRENYERLQNAPKQVEKGGFTAKWAVIVAAIVAVIGVVAGVALFALVSAVAGIACFVACLLLAVCIGLAFKGKTIVDNSEEIGRAKAELDRGVERLSDIENSCKMAEKNFNKQYLLFFDEVNADFEADIKSLRIRLDEYSAAQSRYDAVKDMTVSAQQLEQLRADADESMLDDAELQQVNVAVLEARKDAVALEIARADKKIALNNERAKSRGALENKLAANQSRIVEIDESIRKYEYAKDCAEFAKQGLENAQASMQRQFSPDVSRLVSEILGRITDGRYDKISLDSKLETFVIDETGAARENGYMSAGTVDQIYLSLRLAMIRLIFADGDYPVVCMDDALMNFDNDRMKRAAEYISDEFSKTAQVIFFTCHEAEASCLGGSDLIRL